MGVQDKTIKNIAECREMGIKILPPDINESQADFAVAMDGIRFGLAAVKNVGIKAVESIIEAREKGGHFKDLSDFFKRIEGSKVNRRVLEGLIQCGAFDFTGIHRARLFASLDSIIKFYGGSHDPNQLTIFSSLAGDNTGFKGMLELADVGEWEQREKLKREKEALGFYITGHPLEEYKREVGLFATHTIEGVLNLKEKAEVKAAGVIENLKMKRTKKGDMMAILDLEDQTGSIEVVIFPDTYKNYSVLLKSEDPLVITGIAEVDDNRSKIIAKELEPLGSLRMKAVKTVELGLDSKTVSAGQLEEIRDIFFRNPGECAVLFRMDMGAGEDILIRPNNHYRISPTSEMLREVEGLTRLKAVLRYE
jgi:DNA polymerase-3 subunit alpha